MLLSNCFQWVPHFQQSLKTNIQVDLENVKIAPPPPSLKLNEDVIANTKIKPKLKQLVWDKITTTPTHKTVWSNTTLENVKMDLKELESLFALNEASPRNLTKKVLKFNFNVKDLHYNYKFWINIK